MQLIPLSVRCPSANQVRAFTPETWLLVKYTVQRGAGRRMLFKCCGQNKENWVPKRGFLIRVRNNKNHFHRSSYVWIICMNKCLLPCFRNLLPLSYFVMIHPRSDDILKKYCGLLILIKLSLNSSLDHVREPELLQEIQTHTKTVG